MAREIYNLRKKGVLIIGSGNMVHNLRMVAWDKLNEVDYGFDWAKTINDKFKSLILDGNHQPLINYSELGKDALLAIPTPEHYLPLLYTLGASDADDLISFPYEEMQMGSISMRA